MEGAQCKQKYVILLFVPAFFLVVIFQFRTSGFYEVVSAPEPLLQTNDFGTRSPLNGTLPAPGDGVTDAYNASGAHCTLEAFRAYYKRHHRFPGEGRWVPPEGQNARFQPDFCKLSNTPLDDRFVTKCVITSNLSSILVIGDSNSGRYFRAFLGVLSNVSAVSGRRRSSACEIVLTEPTHSGWFPNASYYRTGDKILDDAIRTHYRYCGNCVGMAAECRYRLGHGGEHRVRVERYSLTSLVDTSVSLLIPQNLTKYHHEYWAPTSAEFLFRYYLRDRYPDLIFFFVPFAHIKQGSNTVERIRGDMEYFHFLARTWLPATTKLFYLTAPTEHEARKPPAWKGRLFQGMLATEKVRRLNRMMYEVLAADLESDAASMFGSLDLADLSRDMGHWSLDGVHMQSVWYEAIVSLLLETVCNSASHRTSDTNQSSD